MLITKLMAKEMDGFILDRFTMFLLYTDYFATYPHDVKFIKKSARLTELVNKGEPLSYGALVTDEGECLTSYLNHWEILIQKKPIRSSKNFRIHPIF